MTIILQYLRLLVSSKAAVGNDTVVQVGNKVEGLLLRPYYEAECVGNAVLKNETSEIPVDLAVGIDRGGRSSVRIALGTHGPFITEAVVGRGAVGTAAAIVLKTGNFAVGGYLNVGRCHGRYAVCHLNVCVSDAVGNVVNDLIQRIDQRVSIACISEVLSELRLKRTVMIETRYTVSIRILYQAGQIVAVVSGAPGVQTVEIILGSLYDIARVIVGFRPLLREVGVNGVVSCMRGRLTVSQEDDVERFAFLGGFRLMRIRYGLRILESFFPVGSCAGGKIVDLRFQGGTARGEIKDVISASAETDYGDFDDVVLDRIAHDVLAEQIVDDAAFFGQRIFFCLETGELIAGSGINRSVVYSSSIIILQTPMRISIVSPVDPNVIAFCICSPISTALGPVAGNFSICEVTAAATTIHRTGSIYYQNDVGFGYLCSGAAFSCTGNAHGNSVCAITVIDQLLLLRRRW